MKNKETTANQGHVVCIAMKLSKKLIGPESV